ncbi:hypothetical protein DYB37_000860 [Aphanomyces astaci]|uniref:Nop domain-containing protein n=1 Tax=Aphanomyces astaci TaxID=112090 RepID=A0A397CJS8_APHAT|nr:hypothetical protein DYB36_007557 [Aphanomyces astaci]RHY29939.1 hypothetical protein DYB25_012498 [Aphanomyces astaci]RHY39461.1 hypothetical protein DYB30_004969 [Aphanomyces astaci]RHY43821.1 hypothetical protein DYB38_002996 [Aphanomyces astaci]RHY83078.1 hypothetical protein DYB35_000709 [Aphanomyces astaci]
MSSLAASFLEDLDELSGSSEEEEEELNQNEVDDDVDMDGEDEEAAAASKAKQLDLDALLKAAANSGAGLAAVAHLRRSESYKRHLESVNMYMQKEATADTLTQDAPEYKLVVASNDLMVKLDDEIIAVHRFLVEMYAKKFPELESLVPGPLDYARVVQRIGNEMDLTLVDLSSLLPSATVMGVSVTGSTTSGKPLSPADLAIVEETCTELLELDSDKLLVLRFVENRMNFLAPNLSALLGTRITAQLVGLAGGVDELSRIPSCNIQVLGQRKQVLSGYSSMSTLKHTGIIFGCDLIQAIPQDLRRKANRVVAGKVALAARVDSQPHRTATVGHHFYTELQDKFEKWQQPQKAKTKKALPRPDEKPRRKRGGKRYRKVKERTQLTDVRREWNRQTFAASGEEYGDNAMGITVGRLGAEGSGQLRVIKKAQKQTLLKLKAASYASQKNHQQSGLATSLAFTPVQGIELMNPSAAAERVREANKKYFNAQNGFMSTIKKN